MRVLRMLPYLGVVRRVRRGPERLFDPTYYLACNPDVAAAKMQPLLHFLFFGAFEGRKPNRLFDPAFYLRKYADVAAGRINPLLHYLKHGAAEGRRPHPLFAADSGDTADALTQFLRALEGPPEPVLYSWWRRQEARVIPPPPAGKPRFSILLAVFHPRRQWLEQAIASVRAQGYPHWELCIGYDPSAETWLEPCLETAARADERIRLTRIASDSPAALALNQAAGLSTGDYLAVLDPNDRLAGNALHWLAAMAPADLIYSDEDRLDAEGARTQPLFKPDWSPDLLLSSMYIGRIMAISRAAWERAGGFRPEREHAFEYDLALRVTEKTGNVQHVPCILYSRGESSHADAEDARYVRRSILDAMERRRLQADVEPGPHPCSFRLQWKPGGDVLASVIICSRSPQLLEQCLMSLDSRTSYRHREVIVVQHLEGSGRGLQEVIARHGAVRVPYAGRFHFSRMNNLGAAAAKGAILIFLNDDTEVLDSSWLGRLVGQAARPEIGVAGARLLYPAGTLQHGGVAIGVGEGCAHIGRGTAGTVPHWPWLDLTRDVSAVTGACLAIRTSVFHEIGGFAERFPVNYNDIDLCLRVRKAGYRVIYDSGVVLRHHECQSRRGTVTSTERDLWNKTWHAEMDTGDPFYNPNLTRRHEDLELDDPIRPPISHTGHKPR